MTSKSKKPSPSRDLMRYAGLGAQLFVSIGIAVFAGHKADGWMGTPIPLLVWVLPLVFLCLTIYKLIKDTAKRKKES